MAALLQLIYLPTLSTFYLLYDMYIKSKKFYSVTLKIHRTYIHTKFSKKMNTSDDDEENDEEGVFILRDML